MVSGSKRAAKFLYMNLVSCNCWICLRACPQPSNWFSFFWARWNDNGYHLGDWSSWIQMSLEEIVKLDWNVDPLHQQQGSFWEKTGSRLCWAWYTAFHLSDLVAQMPHPGPGHTKDCEVLPWEPAERSAFLKVSLVIVWTWITSRETWHLRPVQCSSVPQAASTARKPVLRPPAGCLLYCRCARPLGDTPAKK